MFWAVFELKDLARVEGACVFLRSGVMSNQGMGVASGDACAVLLPRGRGKPRGGVRGRSLGDACAETVGGRPDSPLFRFAILRGSGSGGGSGGWSL